MRKLKSISYLFSYLKICSLYQLAHTNILPNLMIMIILGRRVGGLFYIYDFLKKKGEFDLIGLDREFTSQETFVYVVCI